MNSFATCRTVEERSRKILEPFIAQRAFNGQYVTTDKGRLARELQRTVGDVLMNTEAGHIHSLELKAEEKHTGNLFIETWSNRSRYTVGWFIKLEADALLYHFLDTDRLYIMSLPALKRWLLTATKENGWRPPIGRYAEVRQDKHSQLNDTWGRLVPIDDIRRHVAVKEFSPEAEMATPEQADEEWLRAYGD